MRVKTSQLSLAIAGRDNNAAADDKQEGQPASRAWEGKIHSGQRASRFDPGTGDLRSEHTITDPWHEYKLSVINPCLKTHIMVCHVGLSREDAEELAEIYRALGYAADGVLVTAPLEAAA
jgi:hypothetical protein